MGWKPSQLEAAHLCLDAVMSPPACNRSLAGMFSLYGRGNTGGFLIGGKCFEYRKHFGPMMFR